MIRQKMRCFGIILGVLLILTGGSNLVTLAMESSSEKSGEEELKALLSSKAATAENTETDEAADMDSTVGDRELLPKFEALYELNNDIIGWITIDGTRIDYPVMRGEDTDYYLEHNFYKEDSRYGCLFVKQTADVFAPDTNFVIYGHNMKDGAMLGSLKKYRDEEYFKEHPTITFDTLYEERTYEILSVFQSQVYEDDDEGVFRYYQFSQADTQEEFQDFYDNIKELALYDTGVEAEYGDTFLTLSTCDYHSENARLVVVAKMIMCMPGG